jgi:hypothetical protein
VLITRIGTGTITMKRIVAQAPPGRDKGAFAMMYTIQFLDTQLLFSSVFSLPEKCPHILPHENAILQV